MSRARDDLGTRFLAIQGRLVRWLRCNARGILRFEGEDDLVQDIAAKVLVAEASFDAQGDAAFWSWVLTIAKRHVLDRHDWWTALKRSSERVVRLTKSETSPESGFAALLPAASLTGPGTAAARREAILTLTRALAALPPRDRQLAIWYGEGRPLDDQARELGLSYAAVQKAGLRAVERLTKIFRVLEGS